MTKRTHKKPVLPANFGKLDIAAARNVEKRLDDAVGGAMVRREKRKHNSQKP